MDSNDAEQAGGAPTPKPRRTTKKTTQPDKSPISWPQLKKILSRPIAYHRIFATIAGGAKAGLFLSQGFYWTNVLDDTEPERDGWFYKSQEEWQEETGLTRYEQETARKQLVTRELLKEARRGLPATMHYQFQKEAILRAVWLAINGEPTEPEEEKPARKTRVENAQASSGKSPNPVREVSPKVVRGVAPKKKGTKPQSFKGAESTADTSSDNTTGTRARPGVVVGSSAPPPNDNGDIDTSPLVGSLVQLGVSPKVARDLVKRHPERIEFQLDCLNDREPRDPAATIVKAIREEWAPPGPYLDRQERQAKAEVTRQAHERKAEEDDQAAQRKAEDAARQETEAAALDAAFAQLPDHERAQLETQARERLGVLGMGGRAPAALASMIRALMRERQSKGGEAT